MARTDARAARLRLPAVVAAALLLTSAVASVPAEPARAPTATEVAVDPDLTRTLRRAGSAAAVITAADGQTARVARLVAGSGGRVIHTIPALDVVVAHVDAAALAALRRGGPAVVSVVADAPLRLQSTPPRGTYAALEPTDDTSFVENVGADRLHARGIDGRGVGIAFIDTGLSPVADLRGRILHAIDLTPELDGFDRYGHGTFVAGVAAGSGASSAGEHAGVAPGAHLVSVKVAGADGQTSLSTVLAALGYVIGNRDTLDIGVLNLPLASASTQPWTLDPLNAAVEEVWHRGVVVVVSAGNRGPDPATIAKPGDDPWVITVGATDSAGTADRADDTLADFSSRGPTADGVAKPDLVAPGAHLVGLRSPGSTIDTDHPEARIGEAHFRGSGTSFSAAVVSGAVALLRQSHPDWTPDQVKGALAATAAPGPVGDPTADGRGALDVAAADALADPPFANQGLGRSTGAGSYVGDHPAGVGVGVARCDWLEAPSDARLARLEQRHQALVDQYEVAVGDPYADPSTVEQLRRRVERHGDHLDDRRARLGEEIDQAPDAAPAPPCAVAGPHWGGQSWQGPLHGQSWQAGGFDGRYWQGQSWQGQSWQGQSWQGQSWQGQSWQAAAWQGQSWQGQSWQGQSWQGQSWQGQSWQGQSWQ